MEEEKERKHHYTKKKKKTLKGDYLLEPQTTETRDP